jgi:hypothetical protein
MHQDLRQTLSEIEQVLEEERAALRILDLPAIDVAATRKLQLESRLRELLPSGSLGSKERALLERVRKTAGANQLLLVHARACVRGALALASGQPAEPYAQRTLSSPGPVRVNLKG